jgi:hypothetical protein
MSGYPFFTYGHALTGTGDGVRINQIGNLSGSPQTLEMTASAMAFAVQSINRMPPVTADDMRRLDGLLAEMAEALTNLEEKSDSA